MIDPNNQPWAGFVDRFCREVLEHGMTEAAFVTRNEEEARVALDYYNLTFETRCILIGHMLEDLIIEVIEVNKDLVKDILEREDDGDES